ncbi:MAG TPA: NADH-quinone oxidoreductase subunit H, partial [Burkholderiales bacterium]|nr:NADH-quinone oxidoreductase subunit H [Burkholderiales bacterium]
MIADLVVHVLFMLYAISFMMGLATIFTWVERKLSAIMSDRIGANRCYLRVPFTNVKFVAWGLFHGIADGGKLLLKENFTPTTYDRLCYDLAPWLAAVPVLLVFAVIPFGGT